MDKRIPGLMHGRTCWSLLFGMVLALSTTHMICLTAHAAPYGHAFQSPATQVSSFKDLPPGTAPAITKALLLELPLQYQLKESDQGFAMSNPSHGIDVSFAHDGPRFHSNEKNWGMTLSGVGGAGSVRPVDKAKLINDNGRMLYERDDVSEWYINSRWGVEQGFTVHHPPEGKQEGKALIVELALSGNISYRLDADTLLFADAAGKTVAQYTGLQVFDANNTVLPARLELAGNRLQIHVDDKAANYPIIIDPWIQAAKLTASDAAGYDEFGLSVAISGDTVVVGAYHDDDNGDASGSAYVFVKPGTGWADMNQTAKLTASDGVASDEFGWSVAISGDAVIVGSRYDDDNGDASGSAYVFVKPGTGWADMNQTAKLTAGDGAADDRFGSAVAISGDTVVIGAYQDDDKGSDSGSAYVFVKPGTGWADMNQTAKLTAGDGAADDSFGWSVAISGDAVVIGAYQDDDNGDSSGSAYVFSKPASGWTDIDGGAKLTASDGLSFSYFGFTVAISEDTVVVGAYLDQGAGSAYVFVKPGTGWADMTQTAKLTASDGAANDRFGNAVAISGSTVVVGAHLDDDNGDASGSAYVFEKPAGDWVDKTEDAKLTAGDGLSDDNFGIAVAISGDTVVAGANWDDGMEVDSGSAYIFSSGGAGKVTWGLFLPAILKAPPSE